MDVNRAAIIAAFPGRVRALREGRGWSQREAAAALGLQPLTVLRWENGKTLPAVEQLLTICHVYNVRVEDLLGVPRVTSTTSKRPAA